MCALERKALQLRDTVQEMMRQFRVVDAACADGPQADLNQQELRLLERLGDGGPRMMRELAEYLVLAVNSVTSVVDGLERKGMVVRQRSAEDRRVVHVELTGHGRQAFAAVLEGKLQFLRAMLAVLTEDEQDIFLVLMRKIARGGRSQLEQSGA